ncbi:POU domain class 2-associating factor 1 isoform X1 [Sapajus apella]|uniref:POU domain class 2-associating factor 1 isoform X1 n=1 Tax=Sapajus apella TaxID=9515 RepID=A0A6J3IHL2_SAPAP|nr:POU domain class 2-associating factor 1 isoform X1 [Sapajus apella]
MTGVSSVLRTSDPWESHFPQSRHSWRAESYPMPWWLGNLHALCKAQRFPERLLGSSLAWGGLDMGSPQLAPHHLYTHTQHVPVGPGQAVAACATLLLCPSWLAPGVEHSGPVPLGRAQWGDRRPGCRNVAPVPEVGGRDDAPHAAGTQAFKKPRKQPQHKRWLHWRKAHPSLALKKPNCRLQREKATSCHRPCSGKNISWAISDSSLDLIRKDTFFSSALSLTVVLPCQFKIQPVSCEWRVLSVGETVGQKCMFILQPT